MELIASVLIVIVGLGLLIWKPDLAINLVLLLVGLLVLYGLSWFIGVTWTALGDASEYVSHNGKMMIVMTMVVFCLLGGALK